MRPRITKLKYNPKTERVELKYELPNRGDWDQYELSTKEIPHPDLVAALTAFAPHVLTLCELDDVELDTISVRSVTFTWKNDVMGCVISSLRQLQTSPAPLVLNTPHKTIEPYGEGGSEGALLPDSVIGALEQLLAEAEEFIKGKRGERPTGDEDADEDLGDEDDE